MSPTIFSVTEYEDVLETTFENMRKLGRLKGGEYSGDTDRLANFRRNSRALDLPMEAIWHTYCAKHWDAITQYIQDMVHRRERERLEPIEGRIDDMLVYLMLFKCMLIERARAKA